MVLFGKDLDCMADQRFKIYTDTRNADMIENGASSTLESNNF